MYRIDCSDRNSAIKITYRFMAIPFLTKPECALWKENGMPQIIAGAGAALMPEDDFCKKLMNTDFAAITCTASTDKADKRRVVLTYTPGLGFMVLSFPQADGKLNESEKKIFEYLKG